MQPIRKYRDQQPRHHKRRKADPHQRNRQARQIQDPARRNAAVTPVAQPKISAIKIENSPSDIDTGRLPDVVDRPPLIRQARPEIAVTQYRHG